MKNRNSDEKIEELLANFIESLTEDQPDKVKKLNSEIESLSEEDEDVRALFETVLAISSAIKRKEPSERFRANLLIAAQERFQQQQQADIPQQQEAISMEKLHRIIGMAVTKEDFRKSLFVDVVAACHKAGFELTPGEIAALKSLKEDAVEEFANSLDERITKFFPANIP
jgi:adenosine deaminase